MNDPMEGSLRYTGKCHKLRVEAASNIQTVLETSMIGVRGCCGECKIDPAEVWDCR